MGRRLCILKGIYPREPPNRKSFPGGSTAPKTYYHAKDIKYLLHEPIIEKIRQKKTFFKRLRKAIDKKKFREADRIESQVLYDHLMMGNRSFIYMELVVMVKLEIGTMYVRRYDCLFEKDVITDSWKLL